ncbi:MAG TPA: hypothetical protein VGJ17_05355 [Candidatus Limnocylindrales bacterium]|jgi:hypothetical protein
MTAPARITIELEPPRHQRDRWHARTRVDGDLSAAGSVDSVPVIVAAAPMANDVELGEPSVVPAAYEPPGECTCVEGWCDADHEHE